MYVPLRFPKSLMLRPSIGPSFRRIHSYGNLPYNIIFALHTGCHLPFLGRLLHFVRTYCFFFNLRRTYAYPNFHCVFGQQFTRPIVTTYCYHLLLIMLKIVSFQSLLVMLKIVSFQGLFIMLKIMSFVILGFVVWGLKKDTQSIQNTLMWIM